MFFPSFQTLSTQVELRWFSYADFEMRMLNGELKSEDVDSFINQQKQNDISKIVTDVQNQLNDWKASNRNN